MKNLLMACVFLLLCACGSPDKQENTDSETLNLLHQLEPFTADSLVNVVIEIPAGSNQKWEVNKKTGIIEWEQITPDSFRVINYLPYPANYGFVPQTLLDEATGGDGDAADIFVLGPSLQRETTSQVRIIAIIHMLDDDEMDSKLLAVDVNEPGFNIHSYKMLMEEYPGVVDILKLWLLNYKGTGGVEILSVNDERDALDFLKTAHTDYIEQQNN